MAAVALVAVAVTAMVLAGTDLARRRLPNVAVAAFAAAVAALLATGSTTDGLGPGPALALGLVAGGLGVAVWATGLMGAGDAKVLGPLVAVEAWMGSGARLVWLGFTIVGLAAGLVWLRVRRPATLPAATSGSSAGLDGSRTTVPLGTILLAGVAPSALVLAVWG
ncbi:MAG: hypothetical protein R2761_03055 [Acidimicrobiales bacterium]